MKNKTRLFLAAFVSVLLVVPLAIPVVGEEDVEADLIVDEDWEDDGEENDDGIPVYSNLDAALDNLENGDRLLIEDGNYEWIETGLPNKSLDLIAMNKHGPNIQGSSENYGLLVAELDKDKSMKLEGLVMSDFEVPVLFSSSEGPISDVKAVGNLFEDNYRGLYARAENHDVSNIKFKDNELTRSAYPPLLVGTRDSPETTIEDVKVIGNELYDFRDDQQIAIYMQAYDGGLIRDTLIERNTIYDVYTDHESRGAIWLRGDGTDSKFESINIHWNSLQNTDIALSLNPDVNLDGNLDATLNWWGAKTGPEVYQGGG